MSWLQLKVQSRHPEFAEEILLAHGAQAVNFVDAFDDPVLEPAPGETPLWPHTLVIGFFTDGSDLTPALAALRELLPDGAEATLSQELLEDREWIRAWLDHWQPLRFGPRLWVVPHEKVGEVTQADAVILRLDPGLAFGTGTHPTTAMCLEWLSTQDLRGKTVLDYGCGSGILAIAALLLGADKATCVDLDPQALIATQQNAEANGVAARVKVLLPKDFVPFPADVVLANILSGPLVALAPLLASSVRAGGGLALAGLLDRQAEEVRAAYAPWFAFEPDALREGWTRLAAHCTRPRLINELRLSPTLLSAGQPQRSHFAQLKADGITTVINLAMPTSPNFLPDEAVLCAAQGLRYHAIPVPWENPTRAHLDELFGQLETLQGQSVLVHCALNMRVSAFLFLWRVLCEGKTREEALEALHQIWQPEPRWQEFIDQHLSVMQE